MRAVALGFLLCVAIATPCTLTQQLDIATRRDAIFLEMRVLRYYGDGVQTGTERCRLEQSAQGLAELVFTL